MIRRPWTLLASTLAVAVTVGAAAGGCSGSSRTGGGVAVPSLTGFVLTYTDDAARNVPVRLGSSSVNTRADGLIVLSGVGNGAQVLRVGDSINTPTLLLPVTITSPTQQLTRPLHLPDLASGIAATLPSAIAAVTTVSGDRLPGVTLRFDPGTAVSFPGSQSDVRVLGVSPSRFPTPLGGTRAARAGFLVEPHGVTFTPAATLAIPRLDPASAGPFDAYRVSPNTGAWELIQSDVVATGDVFALSVTRGTLYAVVSRNGSTTVTVTGRIVAGTQPIAGYRVACWSQVSDPTGADGRFEVRDVPTSYGAYLVRAFPAQAGVQFAVEAVVQASTTPNLGDVSVAGRPADQIRPTVVSANPSDGQLSVDQRTQVVVTFSEPIRAGGDPFRVVDSRGTVAGRVNFDSPFQVRFVPAQPLRTNEDHTIVIDDTVEDLTGNRIASALAFRFRTRIAAPDPAPTDTVAYGLSPLSGARGETIAIPGRNFTGGSTVSVGGTNALVTAETTDEVRFSVPDFQPAGDVTVSLAAGGTSVGTLRPLVLDLRAGVARILSGTTPDTPLTVLDRAQPPAAIVVDGQNVGGCSVRVDGVGVAAVDSTVSVASQTVATGRTVTLTTPASPTLFSGPVVLRGSNGEPGRTYGFLLVREP